MDDVSLWKGSSGFKETFSTNDTWRMIRGSNEQFNWARGIWFSMATPKFAFVSWLAMLDRLSTMDRVSKWCSGADTICVLCKAAAETRNHLFFECAFSSQLWSHLSSGILMNSYSNVWSSLVLMISNCRGDKKRLFCIRYAFQAAVYAILERKK